MHNKGHQLQKTPISAPGWDAARPADSFKTFARNIHEKAKSVLLRDGHHSEMFFFLPQDGRGHIVLWRSNDRDLEADWIRKHISEHHTYGVVHVVEAWMHMAKKPGEHTLNQLMDGEIKVSELLPEHRQEALMVSAQSHGGWAISWVDEILRGGDGRLFLGASMAFDDFRGRFGKVFG
ncbi:MAG: hypothetical protein ACOYOU_03145 [Kiritimatiellia bacterium]